jgi:hypothetical protein
MPVKSFRGLIADEGIDVIPLHTNTGSQGYRIKDFRLMSYETGTTTQESLVQIFTTPQTAPFTQTKIDFSRQELIAVGIIRSHDSSAYQMTEQIIFDNVTFNQDIYVCHHDIDTGQPVNYYIELEPVKLDLNQNTVATLKDIRNIATQ